MKLTICLLPFAILAALYLRADGPGIPNLPHPATNVYRSLGKFHPEPLFSGVGPINGSGHSAVGLHRGYLVAPYSYDHGGGYRYGDTGGFQILDISSPTNPVVLFDTWRHLSVYYQPGSSNYLGDLSEVHVMNIWNDVVAFSITRDLTASDYAGIMFVDLKPFFNQTGLPQVLGRTHWTNNTDNYNGYSFKPFWHSGRYVYCPLGTGGLRIIDATDPANPVQVAWFTTTELGNYSPRAATAQGNLLFMHDVQLGVAHNLAALYDISNPTNPVVLGSVFPLDNANYEVLMAGTNIWNGSRPLTAYNISDPAHPVVRTLDPDPPYGSTEVEYMALADDKLFVGTVPGVAVYNLQANGDATLEHYWIAPGPHPGVADYALSIPMGNLVIQTSDHPGNGSHILAHQSAPDTRPPRVLSIHPPDGATNLATSSRFGLCFSETVDVRTITTNTFAFRKANGTSIPGRFNMVQNILNFWPDQPLETNQTYEIVVHAGGFADLVGNPIAAPFRAAFATGPEVVYSAIKAVVSPPVLTNQIAAFTVSLPTNFAAQIPGPYRWSWKFGDGSTTPFSAGSNAVHAFRQPGDYTVEVTLQCPVGQFSAHGVQVVHRPLTTLSPTHSSTIVCDPVAGLVWNVNPDNDTVSALHADTLVKLAEIAVGREPRSLALGPNNELWVANAGSATLSIINRSTFSVQRGIALDPGSRPASVIFSPDQAEAYLTLEDTGELLWLAPDGFGPHARLKVCPHPFGLAATADGRLLVTRFVSPDDAGEVHVVDAARRQVTHTHRLVRSQDPDTKTTGRGLPNYLGRLAVSPDGTTAFVPGKKDNVERGIHRDGLPLDHDNTVRGIGVKLDLVANAEAFDDRVDMDNSDFATAVIYDPYGNLAFFTTLGSHTVVGVQTHSPENTFIADTVGIAPIGLALDAARGRLFIHNFMSRSVSVLDARGVLARESLAMPVLGVVNVVARETLPPPVLRGKQLFHSSDDPRVSMENYLSCASCHFGGGHDGRVWDMTGFGEGLRNTVDLRGHGQGHGPVHWTGNFDEVQDFEQQVRGLNAGNGFLGNAVFARHSPSLGPGRAGLDADLDALAAYVTSLTEVETSPHRNPDGTLTGDALAGRAHFVAAGCASCHSGAAFSDSWSGARHDVGTAGPGSGLRLGGPLDGFDTPTLRGLWRTAPYLHNGAAADLRAVLTTNNPSGRHGNVAALSAEQIDQLVAYLLQIDDREPAAPAAPIALFHPRETLINGTVAVDVRFTEAVTGLAMGDFAVGNGSVVGLFGSGSLYTILVQPGAPGEITIRLPAGTVAGANGSNPDSATARLDYLAVDSFDPGWRYVRLTVLAGVNDWASAAEINLQDAGGNTLSRDGWRVADFSSEGGFSGEIAAHVLDGLNSTFWHSQWATPPYGRPSIIPQHLTLDLARPRVFSRLICEPRPSYNSNGRIQEYEVHVSNDRTNWTPVQAGTWPDSAAAQAAVWTNTPSPRRFFKLLCDLDLAGAKDFRAAEIQLLNPWGSPISPAAYSVSATSTAAGSSVAALSDGNDATAWRAANHPSQPVELQFTFSAATNIGSLRYVPEQDSRPTGDLRLFRFYSSLDGTNWTPVANGELPGATDAPRLATFTGTSAENPLVQNEFLALHSLALAQEPLAWDYRPAPALSAYDRWALASLPATPATLRLPAANADGDPFPNLLEWLFGGNPNQPDAHLPGDMVFSLTNGFLQLRGRVAAPPGTFAGGVAVSTNLTWWTSGPEALWHMSGTPDGGGMYDLQIRYPQSTSADQQFMRPFFRTVP